MILMGSLGEATRQATEVEGWSDAAAAGIDKVYEWTVDHFKDERLKQDYEMLRPEITRAMPTLGGVALALYIGMMPSEGNHWIPNYLGLMILGPALTLADARIKYAPRQPTPSVSSGPTIGPDMRKGESSGLSAGLLRFYELNPRDIQEPEGLGIIMRPYVRREIVFVGRAFLRGKAE
jgi:hypothetical protein